MRPTHLILPKAKQKRAELAGRIGELETQNLEWQDKYEALQLLYDELELKCQELETSQEPGTPPAEVIISNKVAVGQSNWWQNKPFTSDRDEAIERAKTKFDEFDSDLNSSLEVPELLLLIKWLWTVYHPSGQPLNELEQKDAATKLKEWLAAREVTYMSWEEFVACMDYILVQIQSCRPNPTTDAVLFQKELDKLKSENARLRDDRGRDKKLMLDLQGLLRSAKQELKEYQVVKDKLKKCRTELSKVKEELDLSNSRCSELRQKLQHEDAANARHVTRIKELETTLSKRSTPTLHKSSSHRHCGGVSLEKLKVLLADSTGCA